MKQLRIVIIAFILITLGIFIWLTAGTDAQTLLINILTGYLIKHEVILLSSPGIHTLQAFVVGGCLVLLLLLFVVLKARQNRRRRFHTLKGIPYKN